MLPPRWLLAEETGFSDECSDQGLPLLSLFYKKPRQNKRIPELLASDPSFNIFIKISY